MLRRISLIALTLSATAAAGCLERKEHLTVADDGSVQVVHHFKGQPGEFDGPGDALPTGLPWTVKDWDVARDDDGVDHHREARARFDRAADLPTTFGALDDPAPLRFHTEVHPEELPGGGVRWSFERRYEARDVAWRERIFEQHFSDELQDKIGSERPITEATKREALTALLAFERAKRLALLEQAIDRVVAARPGADAGALIRARLGARKRFADWFDKSWNVDLLEKMIDAPQSEKDDLEARFEKESTARATEGAAEIAAALRPAARADEIRDALREAYVTAKAIVTVSEDLQDEHFEVRVTLPGKVVLHDGAELADDGRTVVFKFSGKDLAGGPVVLRAVAEARP